MKKKKKRNVALKYSQNKLPKHVKVWLFDNKIRIVEHLFHYDNKHVPSGKMTIYAINVKIIDDFLMKMFYSDELYIIQLYKNYYIIQLICKFAIVESNFSYFKIRKEHL